MAFPAFVSYRDWQQKQQGVSDVFIQTVKGNIPRLTTRASRLLVFPEPFDIEVLRDILP
jgi:hypothetical protein